MVGTQTFNDDFCIDYGDDNRGGISLLRLPHYEERVLYSVHNNNQRNEYLTSFYITNKIEQCLIDIKICFHGITTKTSATLRSTIKFSFHNRIHRFMFTNYYVCNFSSILNWFYCILVNAQFVFSFAFYGTRHERNTFVRLNTSFLNNNT